MGESLRSIQKIKDPLLDTIMPLNGIFLEFIIRGIFVVVHCKILFHSYNCYLYILAENNITVLGNFIEWDWRI